MARPRMVIGRLLGLFLGLVVVLGLVALAIGGQRRQEAWAWLTYDIHAPNETAALEPLDPANPPRVRLAAAGDVGTGGDEEWTTAAVMDSLEDEQAFDALLLLGDNVYPDGDPADLPSAVFEPFAGVLDNNTALLAVLGNHDVESSDDGNDHAAAIGMPARWYSTRIDDVLVVALDSTRPDDPDQLEWLDETLTANDATWILAIMHHPPYSGGYHGSSKEVRTAFGPFFEEHGVQLALAGHDHDYQRSKAINGITYVVSGGAAKLRAANRAAFTEVAWSTYHFLDILIWDATMIVRAVDQDGRVIDSFTLQP